MTKLPTRANSRGNTITVADFLEAGRARLRLSLIAGGKSLDRVIHEPIVNRPGLALTGFYDHFAWSRVQLIGNGEVAYLNSLDKETRVARIKAMIDRKAFCFVFTNGYKPSPQEIELGESMNAVLLSTPYKTRVFANLATFILGALAAPTATIYGTMVEVAGIGVLFEGAPGLGKSETALGLVKKGAALVADDLTCIRKDVGNDTLYGSACDSTAGFMEIRGIGIVHIPSMYGVNAVRQEKRIQLVITFKRLNEIHGEIDRVGQKRAYRTILGVDVPNVVIPVSEGRDLVILVETAVQQQKLKFAGHNPVLELSERLRRRADERQLTIEQQKRSKRHG
ncbi:MAG: HPr(Ser) kinase/phosphatase [Kiritimatiellae bacterium]|nr:HPr(Ser) kinase/phosphatase [Kiritimatiellia bacterium]